MVYIILIHYNSEPYLIHLRVSATREFGECHMLI